MTDSILTPYAPPPSTAPAVKEITKFNAAVELEYDLDATAALGYDVWRVTEPFKFFVGDVNNDIWVYVPAGYLTDGATVPRPFWDIIPPWGVYGPAAVVHDMLCEYLTIYDSKGQPTAITRHHADNILKDAMTACKTGHIAKWIVYVAVKAYTFFSGQKTGTAFDQKRLLENAWTGPTPAGT